MENITKERNHSFSGLCHSCNTKIQMSRSLLSKTWLRHLSFNAISVSKSLLNKTGITFQYFPDDGKKLLIDVDSKSNDDIIKYLLQVVCKSKETLESEAIAAEKKDNPANFGIGCHRSCMCEIPDQVPCPGVVPLPFHMRGKYKNAEKE